MGGIAVLRRREAYPERRVAVPAGCGPARRSRWTGRRVTGSLCGAVSKGRPRRVPTNAAEPSCRAVRGVSEVPATPLSPTARTGAANRTSSSGSPDLRSGPACPRLCPASPTGIRLPWLGAGEGVEPSLGAVPGVFDGYHTFCGTAGGAVTDQAGADRARALPRAGRTGVVGPHSACPRPQPVLVHGASTGPRLLIFGATDPASALSWAGGFLSYRVTVCDGRPAGATAARFPYADEVVADRPHRYLRRTQVDERTVVCVLTRDAEGDIPLVRLALDLPLGYVGAMGSWSDHEGRLRTLREEGVAEDRLMRLRRLIAFDRSTHTPEEMAVSITAEIISHVSRGVGRPPP
ncbi:XdhC family protein [Streptomyces sp. S12]|uniref:XdhC family protein n=1 Tax=Streptomyces sp. NPDC057115 TaxID=3346022 RepID=UPI0019603FA6|nr:XdhC family protein [Streptomyces sp. S12]